MLRTSEHKRPHILFVGAFPLPHQKIFGGIVTGCSILMKSSFPERAELTLLDSTQISNPPPAFGIRFLLALRRFYFFVSKFELRRPDVVLLIASPGASVVEKGLMAWYARFRGVPALLFPRGGAVIDAFSRSRFTRLWIRAAFRGARKVLCQGPAWQRFAVNLMGLSPADAPIILNWTATPALLSIGRQRTFNAGGRPVRILFVGWLEQEKGIFELIEACRQLSVSRQLVLDIVGKGNGLVPARELVVSYGLENIVSFRGWLKGAELESAFAEADVFALPSWEEGLPNAMIEAMAARLAVVVSSVGNIPDVVVDGREALLVPPKDVPALRSALAQVIDDPVLRRKLGDAAFLLAERQFGVEQAADKILITVSEAIGQFGRDRIKQRNGF